MFFINLERRPATGKNEQIREVQWDIDLHHPVLRKMVNDSHSKNLQMQWCDSVILYIRVLDSWNYMSVIKINPSKYCLWNHYYGRSFDIFICYDMHFKLSLVI